MPFVLLNTGHKPAPTLSPHHHSKPPLGFWQNAEASSATIRGSGSKKEAENLETSQPWTRNQIFTGSVACSWPWSEHPFGEPLGALRCNCQALAPKPRREMLGLLHSSKQKEAKDSYRKAGRLLSGAPRRPGQGLSHCPNGAGLRGRAPGLARDVAVHSGGEGGCGRGSDGMVSQPVETHGLAERLSDPTSNWVAALDCLPAPHFRWAHKTAS